MRLPRNKKDSGWVILAIGLNGLGLLALIGVFVFYLAKESAQAATDPSSNNGISPRAIFTYDPIPPRPTRTPAPTLYYLSTITPNPRATEIEEYYTPTPFIFENGPAPGIIGYSVLGRAIEAYAFGQGEHKYLIVAGIHGGYEGNTIALANQLMVYINGHPEVIPADDTLYVIPDMNPDAAARGRNADARVNADGVDLNRNFPTANWAANWDHANCWNERPTTGGTYPGSEPETKTIINFLSTHQIEAMISYHSAGLGIFPGGTPWDADSERLAQALADVTTYPFPPIDTGCVYTGTLADYAVSQSIAAVDMELTNHHDTDFSMNLRVLNVLVNFSK